jgi:hypothetical protein
MNGSCDVQKRPAVRQENAIPRQEIGDDGLVLQIDEDFLNYPPKTWRGSLGSHFAILGFRAIF